MKPTGRDEDPQATAEQLVVPRPRTLLPPADDDSPPTSGRAKRRSNAPTQRLGSVEAPSNTAVAEPTELDGAPTRVRAVALSPLAVRSDRPPPTGSVVVQRARSRRSDAPTGRYGKVQEHDLSTAARVYGAEDPDEVGASRARGLFRAVGPPEVEPSTSEKLTEIDLTAVPAVARDVGPPVRRPAATLRTRSVGRPMSSRTILGVAIGLSLLVLAAALALRSYVSRAAETPSAQPPRASAP